MKLLPPSCLSFFIIALYPLLLQSLSAQQTIGLFKNDSLSYNGYTLFSNNEKTYLIDNCGYEVHRWESNFKPGQSAYLLEDGDLLRTASLDGNFNAGGVGGRFELFNWEGDLLWSWAYADEYIHAHHDIAPMPNGHFLLLAWEYHSEEEAAELGFQANHAIWSERIVEVAVGANNGANIIWEWRLWDHLIQDINPQKSNYAIVADHPELVDINFAGTPAVNPADWFHLNAIDYNPTLDQIAVSSRNFSEIWIIDHSTTTQEAASHFGGLAGKGGDLLYRYGNPQAYQKGTEADQIFFLQHDVHWVPKELPYEGHLMVFNNQFTSHQSRVEIWAPIRDESGQYQLNISQPVWTFEDEGFYSSIMSSAQVLPNANVLICEGETGRFFEVTPDKEIVWEYINPINKFSGPMVQGANFHFNEAFRISRYGLEYPAFSNKEITPGPPLEINPFDNKNCSYAYYEAPELKLEIKGNPIQEHLIIYCNQPIEKVPLTVYDINGRLVYEHSLHFGENYILLSEFSAGVYFTAYWSSGERKYLGTIIKSQ